MAAKTSSNKATKGTASAKKASRSPASQGAAKAAPAKSTAKPATRPATKNASTPKSAAKAPSKSPVKGASKAVSTTTSKTSKPTVTQTSGTKTTASKTTASKTTASKTTASRTGTTAEPAAKPAPSKQPAKKAATAQPIQSVPAPQPADESLPKPKFNKEGIGYTKDFDLPFVKAQFDLLQRERIHLTGQAKRLEAEAHQLVEEAEMGDVQFDDEGGEGDTMVVERERDLALSAQARDAVAEIDAAIARITAGTYGYSIMSGRPIPKERLEAIPWSSVLVEEKVGGIGRR
jgi:RNA polymerase-binding transcription factor DksA